MPGLIVVQLLARALSTGTDGCSALGVSFVQLRAQVRKTRKDATEITKLSAATHETPMKSLNIVTRAEDLVMQRIHQTAPSSPSSLASWYFGCMDPEATNYDPHAHVDSGLCYYGTQPPDYDYSFSANQRMNPGDALVMYQMGHILGKLFDKYDIRWWVTDGSLLGAFRNKGIIPHDDDIDLNVLAPQVARMKANDFREELHLNGLHLNDDLKYKDRMYVWNYTEYNRTRGHANERGTRMKLDLWPLEHVGGRWQQLVDTEHAFPGHLCNISLTTRMPTGLNYSCLLERRQFGEQEVWAPRRPTAEGYLAKRYGAWDSVPECIGTLHKCHLIENVTHDMLRYAAPAGPLIEPVATQPVATRSHAFRGSSSSALALLLPMTLAGVRLGKRECG